LSVYLKGYIKESILGPLLKLLEASFELLVPIVIKSIVDTGIGGLTKYISLKCAVVDSFGCCWNGMFGNGPVFFRQSFSGFVTKLRRALFRHIGQLSYTEIDTLVHPV